MPTILAQLRDAFRTAIRDAYSTDADPLLVATQNENFGDYQCNAAMALAKQLKLKPRDVAERIKTAVRLEGIAEKLDIAGPGFINIYLSSAWVRQKLSHVASDDRLGVDRKPAPQTVVVDYSAPNIAKEMHVGHLRSTIIGDAIARVLDFLGDRVIRQNHIGDWGTQFGRVILSVWYVAMAKRKHNDFPSFQANAAELNRLISEYKKLQERARTGDEAKRANASKEVKTAWQSVNKALDAFASRHRADYSDDPTGEKFFRPYVADYVPDLQELLPMYQLVGAFDGLDVADQHAIDAAGHTLASLPRYITYMLQRGTRQDAQELEVWWKVREATLDHCQELYERLNVLLSRRDEYGESRYHPMLPRVVGELEARGIAVESAEAKVIFTDGPDRPPLIIEKKGGEGYLYGTTDLAAAWYRVYAIGAQRILYFVDARQANHFSQVFKAIELAGWRNGASLEHAAFGTMLGKDNKPFKTRSGDVVKLKDLLDEAQSRALNIVEAKNPLAPLQVKNSIAAAIGIGAVKYGDLSKDRTSDYVFDFDTMLAMEGNTAPYLQYAHARICSIFRKSGVAASAAMSTAPETPQEIALAKHILRLGEILDNVARELKPHLLCTYLYDLATRFSAFYENCPVLKSDEPVRSQRLALCAITARTMALGLDLLGIEHPEQM